MNRGILVLLGATLGLLQACAADELQFTSVFAPNDAGIDASVSTRPFCTIAPPGAICEHEDGSFVAHCVDGQCVPFGCDYCPKPTCHDVFCVDGQCRQQAEPFGTPCVNTAGAAGAFGYLGACGFGQCGGLTECSDAVPCPEIPCASVVCNDFWCKATFVAAGTTCSDANGTVGLCSNHECITQ